jgi:hypothetical protein
MLGLARLVVEFERGLRHAGERGADDAGALVVVAVPALRLEVDLERVGLRDRRRGHAAHHAAHLRLDVDGLADSLEVFALDDDRVGAGLEREEGERAVRVSVDREVARLAALELDLQAHVGALARREDDAALDDVPAARPRVFGSDLRARGGGAEQGDERGTEREARATAGRGRERGTNGARKHHDLLLSRRLEGDGERRTVTRRRKISTRKNGEGHEFFTPLPMKTFHAPPASRA